MGCQYFTEPPSGQRRCSGSLSCLTCRLHARLPQSPSLSTDRGDKCYHGKAQQHWTMHVITGVLLMDSSYGPSTQACIIGVKLHLSLTLILLCISRRRLATPITQAKSCPQENLGVGSAWQLAIRASFDDRGALQRVCGGSPNPDQGRCRYHRPTHSH
jgi:hypothetical protein